MPAGRENHPQHRNADKRAILRDHYLFRKLTPQQIDRLGACIVGKTVKRGTHIFAKGDAGSSLFAIGTGTVRISVPSAEGKDAVLNVVSKGDIFGEIALLKSRSSSLKYCVRACAGPANRPKRSCSSTYRAVSPRR
jgi:CRP-like cAMP-binding protein